MNLREFIAVLDDSADPVQVASARFAELTGVEDDLGELVEAADRTRQLSKAQAIRVPDVEPMVWPLLNSPGHYDIVLNAYDPDRFERLRAAGHITPHRHHFAFASTVLNGGLAHFLFDNDGELDNPSLRPRSQEFVGRSGQLLLDPADYHCVLSPKRLTATLMVRGAPVHDNPFLGDDSYCMSQFVADRAMLLDALAKARDAGPAMTPGTPR